MQNIELYIEGQRVDMFKDETVSITDTIQNVKKIDKIFTAFSRTFSLPATKINNKIFKHYYNFDIVGGFDARIKKNSNIELNSLPFKDGKIKLEGVDLKDNKPHTYRITFFGSTVTLKDLLGDDKLQSLDLTDYDKEYSFTAVRSALTFDPNAVGVDVVVPLISHTKRLFYDSGSHTDDGQGNLFYDTGHTQDLHGVLWSDLKYAIRIDKIIQAIGVKYGLTFSDDFFNSSNEHYYNLFLWLHRKKGDVENLSGVNQSIVDGWLGTIGSPEATLTQMVSATTMRVTGDPFNYLGYSLTFTSTTTSNYKISLQKDGVEVYNTGTVTQGVTMNQNDFNLEQGDYTAYVESDDDISFSEVEWDILYNLGGGSQATSNYATGIYNHTSTFDFSISQQIPEMKTLDFLTGIFKTFNLTAYVDKLNGNIIVKTLDDFYSDGGVYDITKYVDNSKGSVNIALPFREINFEHEDTKTFLASKHNQLFGKVWGKESYVGGEKLDGGIYNIKTPFSQLKYEHLVNIATGLNTDVQVGYFVDDNQESYFGKPLIFYPIKQTNATPISFLTTPTAHVQQTIYNIPSNSVALSRSTSKKNINFYNELNEYSGGNDFTDTLFEMYYKNYITSVFNPKNRITKVSAYLPMKILLNYTLADRFILGDHQYKINSITTNFKNGKSEIELLNDL